MRFRSFFSRWMSWCIVAVSAPRDSFLLNVTERHCCSVFLHFIFRYHIHLYCILGCGLRFARFFFFTKTFLHSSCGVVVDVVVIVVCIVDYNAVAAIEFCARMYAVLLWSEHCLSFNFISKQSKDNKCHLPSACLIVIIVYTHRCDSRHYLIWEAEKRKENTISNAWNENWTQKTHPISQSSQVSSRVHTPQLVCANKNERDLCRVEIERVNAHPNTTTQNHETQLLRKCNVFVYVVVAVAVVFIFSVLLVFHRLL